MSLEQTRTTHACYIFFLLFPFSLDSWKARKFFPFAFKNSFPNLHFQLANECLSHLPSHQCASHPLPPLLSELSDEVETFSSAFVITFQHSQKAHFCSVHVLFLITSASLTSCHSAACSIPPIVSLCNFWASILKVFLPLLIFTCSKIYLLNQ